MHETKHFTGATVFFHVDLTSNFVVILICLVLQTLKITNKIPRQTLVHRYQGRAYGKLQSQCNVN